MDAQIICTSARPVWQASVGLRPGCTVFFVQGREISTSLENEKLKALNPKLSMTSKVI